MNSKAPPPASDDFDDMNGIIPNQDGGVKAIADLVAKSAGVEEFEVEASALMPGIAKGKIPVLLDRRPGQGIVDIKGYIEKFRISPERRTGTAQVTTLKSFIDLVNRQKDGDSVIFANTAWPRPSLTGVINYHKGSEGGFAARQLDHRVHYAFPVTEEMQAWIGNNNRLMDQADFAAFLEDHAAELTSPFDGEKDRFEALFKERMAVPTELVSLSRSLEVFVGAKAKQAVRLQTGERVMEFVEEHSNGKGEKVEIPGVFMIAVPAFLDGEPVRIAARLRYRVAGGGINWFYSLYRWDVELRERVKADLATAATETSLAAYEGAPEA